MNTEQDTFNLLKYRSFDASINAFMWRNDLGQIHRENGPAVEYTDGSKCWFIDGKRHRIDGPAVENADGSKFWWVNGELHRVDGPAAENADGSKFWWVNGKQITEIKFNEYRARHV